MLNKLKTMAARYERYMTYVGKMKTRQVLLQCSNRTLEDLGISRDLLDQGIKAWPWHAVTEQPAKQSIAYTTQTKKQAIKELAAYSDSELHDLGITRGTINEAVMHGRHGIERQDQRKAA